jgi:hypothetical protein
MARGMTITTKCVRCGLSLWEIGGVGVGDTFYCDHCWAEKYPDGPNALLDGPKHSGRRH